MSEIEYHYFLFIYINIQASHMTLFCRYLPLLLDACLIILPGNETGIVSGENGVIQWIRINGALQVVGRKLSVEGRTLSLLYVSYIYCMNTTLGDSIAVLLRAQVGQQTAKHLCRISDGEVHNGN